jgi:aldehyde:ferredoxin oxidoreductase
MSTALLYKGYTRKILRVNLTAQSIEVEELPNGQLKKYIGGAGLAARILYDELAPGIDPLSPENKVIFLAGPLAGTIPPTGSRIGVYTKSPLTGGFFHSSAGGHCAPELKYAGYDGVIIEGASTAPVYLYVNNERTELRSAAHVWGERTDRTQQWLKADIGDESVQLAVIGPAGERLVRFANIVAGCRALGRGGIGAVLGAKKFKGLAVRGKGKLEVHDMPGTLKLSQEILQIMRGNPATGQVLPWYGTPVLVNANNSLGVFGARNWQQETFEGAQGLCAETMRQKIVVRDKSCFACPIKCGKYSVVTSAPFEGRTVEGPEYENIFALGSMCGIDSIEAVAAAERECDDLGMDAIETGVSIAFAMENFEKGNLTAADTGGMELAFGKTELLLPLIHKIGMREGIGSLLAEGVKRAAEKIGKGVDSFAMQNKGLTFAGHSARGLPGFALGYATGPRGGSHHDSRPTGERTGLVPRDTIEGKAAYTIKVNHLMIFTDSLILCHLAEAIWGPIDINPVVVDILNRVTGMDLTVTEAELTAERMWNVIRAFAVREGLRRKDDTLPRRFLTEPIPDGPSKGMVITQEMLERMKDEYYALRGWDKETGIPTPERLLDLDLPDIAEDMKNILRQNRGR